MLQRQRHSFYVIHSIWQSVSKKTDVASMVGIGRLAW